MMDLQDSMGRGARALFYSHDTFGLGHLRRTLTLARHFRSSVPELSQLIVTGSPVASRFEYPDDTDFIKLPSVTKDANGDYEPRNLTQSTFESVRNMRRDIMLSAARNFRPDVFIVDHAPAGLRGEVVDSLRYLKQHSPDTRLVVGLRDIMDDACTVRQTWADDGAYELFDDIYDMILVYGNRDFYDVVSEYGLSEKAADKTRFVGYLGREPGSRSREEVRAGLNMQTDHLVVVTAGGGGDGKALYEAVLRDLTLADQHDFDCLIIGGPLLSSTDRAEVRERLGNRGNVHFLDFTTDLASYLGAADAVISMGGYNSVCEILSLHQPSLIVPRIHPRQEQLIRASILSSRGLVSMLHPSQLEPKRLINAALDLLSHGSSMRPTIPMDGLQNAFRAIHDLRSGDAGAWQTA